MVVGTSIVVSPYSAPARPRLARRVARAVWGVATILAIVAIGIVLASLSTPAPEAGYVRGSVALFALAWAAIGGRIAVRYPNNAVGWFMLAAGIGFGLLAHGQLPSSFSPPPVAYRTLTETTLGMLVAEAQRGREIFWCNTEQTGGPA